MSAATDGITALPGGLPVHVARHGDESTESHLERVAEANLLTNPELLRSLDPFTRQAPCSSRPAPAPGVQPTGWTCGRSTQLCPRCHAATVQWSEVWRHPMASVCLTHATWLLATCPTCRLPFRSHSHRRLRSVDARPGTCGNPTGHRGRPCPQDLAQLAVQPIDDESVLASQQRIHAAVAGTSQTVIGSTVSAEDHLAEIKAFAVLLLHLAVQPGGHTVAPWAGAARVDRDRSPGNRTARWGLAPPTDPTLRGRAIAAADRILTSPDLDEAAERLHPWTELAPATGDGQLGWLADHTRMTPLLTRLVMAATATRRRVSTLLDHDPPSPRVPVTAIPQAVPAQAFVRHVALHLDVGDTVGRAYVALCLARRHTRAGSWADTAELLGIRGDLAHDVARRGSSRITCRPDTFVTALDALAAALDPTVDYRAREDAVGRLATRTLWYRRWARGHHRGSHATSQPYAITWLWTQWAGGLLATSPGWPTPPDRITRGYYRRYAQRLPLSAKQTLLDRVEPSPTRNGDPS